MEYIFVYSSVYTNVKFLRFSKKSSNGNGVGASCLFDFNLSGPRVNSNNINMFKQEGWGVEFNYVNDLISQVGF